MKRAREEDEEEEEDLPRAEKSICYESREWVRGRLLGRGGFGSVHVALFPNPTYPPFADFPSTVAVKSTLMASATELASEKKTLDRLNDCPFIVRCLGNDVTVDEAGRLSLNVFLEYASGGTLSALVASSNGGAGLPEPQARRFTKHILEGLRRIHREGLVHRDLKLANVLLFPDEDDDDSSDSVAKVADLGLTCSVEDGGEGRVCGTRAYWAPEVWKQSIQGQASDIWALGCMVFRMLTGKCTSSRSRRLSSLPLGIYSKEAEDFVDCMCFQSNLSRRATADELLRHPFVTGEYRKEDTTCSEEEDTISSEVEEEEVDEDSSSSSSSSSADNDHASHQPIFGTCQHPIYLQRVARFLERIHT